MSPAVTEQRAMLETVSSPQFSPPPENGLTLPLARNRSSQIAGPGLCSTLKVGLHAYLDQPGGEDGFRSALLRSASM